ncbi:MAG TPA: PAS domain-containing protein [Ktedonobacteraceae bacterium]|jgi:PAS domain S-box-containing protein|nr:PAS domain-containing protein [Ktedonobacteraceae bacterium]
MPDHPPTSAPVFSASDPETQKRLADILENMSDAFFALDNDWRFIYLNKQAEVLLQKSREALLGKSVWDEFAEAVDSTFYLQYHLARQTGDAVHFEEFYPPLDTWFQVHAYPNTEGISVYFANINERKRIEQERDDLLRRLQEANALLDSLFDEAPIGLGFWDKDLRYARVNEALAEINGLPAEAHIGKTITELLPHMDEQVIKDFRRVIEEGKPILAQEVRGQTPAAPGKERYWSVSYYPVSLRGEIVGAGAVCEEITEKKKAEERNAFINEVSKILASTLDYQETLANIAQIVVPELADWFTVDILNEQGELELIEVEHKDPEKVRWARELREKYPVDMSTATGEPFVIRTGQSELYEEISDEMLVAGARSEEELAIARQIGFTSVMIVPLVARGKTLGAVSFVSAESRKRYNKEDLALAEELGRRAGIAIDNARLYREAQEAHNQLEVIIQGVADGIIVYNPSGSIIYVNEAAAQMIRLSPVEILQPASSGIVTSQFEMITEEGEPYPLTELPHIQVLHGASEAQAIIGYRYKNNPQEEHWSITKSRPVYDEHGNILLVITIIHDITEREQAERRKDEFINMASHELKTPVTSLKGFNHVLHRRMLKQGDEQSLHYLTRMDAQLNKLTQLISDLLDISRMQTGKLVFREEAFDLAALVQETVENLQGTTNTHQFMIEQLEPARVVADKDRIGQVLINLLTNAVKYSPGAEKVSIRLACEKDYARVSIQDFGIGIAEAHQPRIFERFYQVTDPEEKTYPGLGIGLYIASEIIKRHNGQIWVESTKGKGATFYFTVPLKYE